MLGSGFIARFYADSIQGFRKSDRIVSVYSRRKESAEKFAADYQTSHSTTNMEEAIAHPDVDMVCIALPNNLHEEAVMFCCKICCTSISGDSQATADSITLFCELQRKKSV